jgi:hypothetical protein
MMSPIHSMYICTSPQQTEKKLWHHKPDRITEDYRAKEEEENDEYKNLNIATRINKSEQG